MTSKNYGPGVTGYLDPEARNWETTVYQAAKPVLEKELNLSQDVGQNAARVLQRRSFPSGWISDSFLNDTNTGMFVSNLIANTLTVSELWASVNGWTLDVTDTNNNTGANQIDLGAGPSGAGSKRTDLVILEVWRRLISASPSVVGKSASGRIWRNGNVKVAPADDLTLNFADDILDGTVGAATTIRVQVQYRLRVITGVNLFTYAFGMNDPTVVARSVPATAAAPDGTATVFAYTNQSSLGDSGLWVAGDGNSANTLGTVDGYMYAIPLCAVFRRNTTAFARNTNHNGGVTYPSASDRPDNLYADILTEHDLIDLRQGVSPTGWDLQEILQKNMNFLLDNVNQTEIGNTTSGGGVEGHTVLWADEIGVSNVNGGDGVITGDTPGASFVGEFDAVRRRYSDRPIYETLVVSLSPNSPGVSPGGANWTVGTVITLSPSALPIWPYTAFNWASYAPAGVTVLEVQKAVFVGTAAGKISFEASANIRVEGLGGVPQGSILIYIDSITDPVAVNATNETLYLTLLVEYPAGAGLNKTPSQLLGNNATISSVQGVTINNPAQLPVASPILYSSLVTPVFRAENREVQLAYRTLSHTFSYRPNSNTLTNFAFHLPERPVVGTVSVTVNGVPYVGTINISTYVVVLNPIFTGGENVVFTYQSERALPQNGEQLTIYYKARLSQTVREFLLPASLTLTARLVSQQLCILTAGSGSDGSAYPFPYQYVQAGGVYPGSGGTFSGDHELDGDMRVSIPAVYTDTGFMQVPAHIPLVPSPNGVTFGRSPGDEDIEGRTYYKTATGYGFLAVGPTLSDPKKHRNLIPLLCELPANNTFGFKGQLILVLLSRWANFDDSNKVGFVGNLVNNFTSASVYRLKGNLLSNRRA